MALGIPEMFFILIVYILPLAIVGWAIISIAGIKRRLESIESKIEGLGTHDNDMR